MPTGFIRVKLLQCERGGAGADDTEMFDPYVAVNVKEATNLPGKCHIMFSIFHINK